MALFKKVTSNKGNKTCKLPGAMQGAIDDKKENTTSKKDEQSHYDHLMGQSYLAPYGATLSPDNAGSVSNESFLNQMDRPSWTENDQISRSFGATIRLARTQGLLH